MTKTVLAKNKNPTRRVFDPVNIWKTNTQVDLFGVKSPSCKNENTDLMTCSRLL